MESRAGRPRASSRETLAEAACELFLERGYEETSIADIARRAGVSRSSFFNYFDSKADVFWGGFDERIAAFAARDDEDPAVAIASAFRAFAPGVLSLGLMHAEAMGAAAELERDAATRVLRIGRIAASRIGGDPLAAEVRGIALGGAVLAAVRAWSAAGPGRTPFDDVLGRALAAVPG